MTTLRRHKQLPATWRIVLNEYSQVDVDATNSSNNVNLAVPSRYQNSHSRDAGCMPQLTSYGRRDVFNSEDCTVHSTAAGTHVREQAAFSFRTRVIGGSDDSTSTKMIGKRYRTRRELDALAGVAHPHTGSFQQHPSAHNVHYRQQHTAPAHRVHSSNSRTNYSLKPSLGAVESTQRVVAYPREIPRRID